MSLLILRYKKTLAFILGTLLLSLSEAKLSCCERPIERPMWQGAEGGLWPTASKASKASEVLKYAVQHA